MTVRNSNEQTIDPALDSLVFADFTGDVQKIKSLYVLHSKLS